MCFVINACKYYAHRYPKKFSDIAHPSAIALATACTIFLAGAEMLYVAPQLFGTEGPIYKIFLGLTIFISYNIFGNLLAVYRVDSSVAKLALDKRTPKPDEAHLWHHCDLCNVLVPPRSWHCKVCHRCILKRDHHCIFTATCIGFNNQRYFFWYTFYTTLGTASALIANYILVYLDRTSLTYQLTFARGLAIWAEISSCKNLWSGCGNLWLDAIITINILAFLAPLFMLILQCQAIIDNTTYYLPSHSSYTASVLENIKEVLGQRWYFTFLSPRILSPLPHDGTHWESKQRSKIV
ncbi:hypothetical protein KR018_010238 [Drosophila ironensis]|nr:hypothetical protein KR018_010238 [Drosophila ironensis]